MFSKYDDIFGFLFSLVRLRSFDNCSLEKKCLDLENFLKHDMHSDIDGLDLFSELKILKEIAKIEINTPIEILNLIKELNCFPNCFITYRILLTIPVTVASAERSFSKLKIIKNYLRTTMSQDRLNGLAILSIENDLLSKLEYKSLISNFASRKARSKFMI